MRISRDDWDELVAHARDDAPNECCGYLWGKEGVVEGVKRAENPRRSPYGYELDHRSLFAVNELDDARDVLATGKVAQPFYPVAVDRIDLAKAEIAAAIAAPASSRGGRISNAISRVENARDQIGANINFTLGSGNLFF